MVAQKTKCVNPECGHDVSDNVKRYSLDNYGVILCYPCQELVRSGKLDVNVLEETLKKKGTLEGYANDDDEELKEFDEKLNVEGEADMEAEEKELDEKIIETGKGKVNDAEVVEEVEGEEREEPEWRHTVETDEGAFSFRKEGEKLLCKGANDNVYELDVKKPYCSCADFEINKQKQEWCKHLKAAKAAGYDVKELPKMPADVKKALAKPEKKEKSRRTKPKKEEVVAITVLNKDVEIPIQTPSEMIMSEDKALETIKGIIGPTPKKDDVIESYAGIEELNADVILSLSSYLGIPYRIVEKEIEKTRMSVGKIYELTATDDQMRKYGPIAKIMPEVDIVTRCKVTVAAAWKDKSGSTRISVGVKEELLTPFELSDISKRGTNFIETKAITKASKKALLSVLPITHDGLKSKIKEAYHWK